MTLPPSELNRISQLTTQHAQAGFIPRGTNIQYTERIANVDPTAVDGLIAVLVEHFRRGLIDSGYLQPLLDHLRRLAEISEHLRDRIASTIDTETLDFYVSRYEEAGVNKAAERLSDTLKIERPRHYYDLAKGILAQDGSIFVVGAGFSYDSHAPLIREMEGVAHSILFDLDVPDHKQLYQNDEREAWQLISRDWQRFQNHMAAMLLSKEPSQQHITLAELFHDRKITHIVSLNWDNLVEKAYNNLYGEDIPIVTAEGTTSDHALWKLHGDVAKPDERWVLPFEDGRVFQDLERIAADTICRTFVIGYRELEPVVCSQLLIPLEHRGGITRIGPDVANNPPDSFADGAKDAMIKISAGLRSAEKSRYPE